MRTPIAVIVTAVLLSATAAQAGVIHRRQSWQEHRIQRGVCRGSLTGAEARVLHAEQRSIARARGRALSDGAITRQEARFLARIQHRADRQIDRLMRNRRTGPGW
jgi:hypothetical protein